MEDSRSDRAGIREELRRTRERSEEQHDELLVEIRQSNHSRANDAQTVHNLIALERSRLDKLEAKAGGAAWVAGIFITVGGVAGSFVAWLWSAIQSWPKH